MPEIKRTTAEIDAVLDKTWEAEDSGSRYPGMKYEEGVRAGIDWLLGNCEENPFDD